jgi:hypothetical protein
MFTGKCVLLEVKFCLDHKVPYNYTLFPNYLGDFSQSDAQTVSHLLILRARPGVHNRDTCYNN